MNSFTRGTAALVAGAVALGWILSPAVAWGHCDTLDGPVVMDARTALQKGDVTPVLKWVRQDHEAEIREAFDRTLAVRTKGPEARELADRYFFETLVRVHRAGENAPYTGLKEAGTPVGPAVSAADKALESGSGDAVVKLVADAVVEGIRKRYARAAEARKHADESVEAGRKYVEAYVEFVHYVERIHEDAQGHAGHHGEGAQAAAADHHAHGATNPDDHAPHDAHPDGRAQHAAHPVQNHVHEAGIQGSTD